MMAFPRSTERNKNEAGLQNDGEIGGLDAGHLPVSSSTPRSTTEVIDIDDEVSEVERVVRGLELEAQMRHVHEHVRSINAPQMKDGEGNQVSETPESKTGLMAPEAEANPVSIPHRRIPVRTRVRKRTSQQLLEDDLGLTSYPSTSPLDSDNPILNVQIFIEPDFFSPDRPLNKPFSSSSSSSSSSTTTKPLAIYHFRGVKPAQDNSWFRAISKHQEKYPIPGDGADAMIELFSIKQEQKVKGDLLAKWGGSLGGDGDGLEWWEVGKGRTFVVSDPELLDERFRRLVGTEMYRGGGDLEGWWVVGGWDRENEEGEEECDRNEDECEGDENEEEDYDDEDEEQVPQLRGGGGNDDEPNDFIHLGYSTIYGANPAGNQYLQPAYTLMSTQDVYRLQVRGTHFETECKRWSALLAAERETSKELAMEVMGLRQSLDSEKKIKAKALEEIERLQSELKELIELGLDMGKGKEQHLGSSVVAHELDAVSTGIRMNASLSEAGPSGAQRSCKGEGVGTQSSKVPVAAQQAPRQSSGLMFETMNIDTGATVSGSTSRGKAKVPELSEMERFLALIRAPNPRDKLSEKCSCEDCKNDIETPDLKRSYVQPTVSDYGGSSTYSNAGISDNNNEDCERSRMEKDGVCHEDEASAPWAKFDSSCHESDDDHCDERCWTPDVSEDGLLSTYGHREAHLRGGGCDEDIEDEDEWQTEDHHIFKSKHPTHLDPIRDASLLELHEDDEPISSSVTRNVIDQHMHKPYDMDSKTKCTGLENTQQDDAQLGEYRSFIPSSCDLNSPRQITPRCTASAAHMRGGGLKACPLTGKKMTLTPVMRDCRDSKSNGEGGYDVMQDNSSGDENEGWLKPRRVSIARSESEESQYIDVYHTVLPRQQRNHVSFSETRPNSRDEERQTCPRRYAKPFRSCRMSLRSRMSQVKRLIMLLRALLTHIKKRLHSAKRRIPAIAPLPDSCAPVPSRSHPSPSKKQYHQAERPNYSFTIFAPDKSLPPTPPLSPSPSLSLSSVCPSPKPLPSPPSLPYTNTPPYPPNSPDSLDSLFSPRYIPNPSTHPSLSLKTLHKDSHDGPRDEWIPRTVAGPSDPRKHAKMWCDLDA